MSFKRTTPRKRLATPDEVRDYLVQHGIVVKRGDKYVPTLKAVRFVAARPAGSVQQIINELNNDK